MVRTAANLAQGYVNKVSANTIDSTGHNGLGT